MVEECCVIDKFLGDEGLVILLNRLRASPTSPLKKLVLRGNNLGLSGSTTLAMFLKEQVASELKHLSLEWNQLGNAGVAALVSSFLPSSLTSLDLRNNSIQNEGAESLAAAIEKYPNLVLIDLRWNKIEDAGSAAFKPLLLNRKPPLQLLINGNLLSSTATCAIQSWSMGVEEEDQAAAAAVTKCEEEEDVEVVLEEEEEEEGDENKHFRNEAAAPVQQGWNRNISPSASFRSAAALDVQSSLLQKESAQLRLQNAQLEEQLRDMQRQLDSAATRVTEMEQAKLKEEYRTHQLSDSLEHAQSRIKNQCDELKTLTDTWAKERSEALDEMKKTATAKEEENKILKQERDRLSQQLQKQQDKSEALEVRLKDVIQQGKEDREGSLAELRDVLAQVTELQIAENKLKSDLLMAQNESTRAQQRVLQVEQELVSTREQSEVALKEEMKKKDVLEDSLRAEASTQASIAADKSARQTRELAELYKQLADLQAEMTTQRVKMQQQSEHAAITAREEENKKCEALVSDLKSKLQTYMTSIREVEARCEGYLVELTTTTETHNKLSAQLTSQLEAMEIEMQRQREQNATLQLELSTKVAACTEATTALRETSTTLEKIQTQLESTNSLLATSTAERSFLQNRVVELEQSAATFETERVAELKEIAEEVLARVQSRLLS